MRPIVPKRKRRPSVLAATAAPFALACLAALFPLPPGWNAPMTADAALAASPRDSARARRIYREGLDWYARDRLVEALRAFRQSTYTGIELPEAVYAQGLCTLKLEGPREAAPLFERALELDPANAEAHYHLAITRLPEGRTGEARVHLERAVSIDSAHAGAHQALSRIHDEAGRPVAAIEAARRAVAAAPGAAGARAQLGLVLLHAGAADSALHWLDAALAADPTLFEAHVQRGAALSRLERPGEAAAAYGAALDRDSTRADLWAARGQMLMAAGHPEMAAPCYRRASRLDTLDARLPFNLGLALHETAPERAVTAYLESMRRDPSYADPCVNAAGLLVALGRHAEAVRCYERFLEIAPDSPMAPGVRQSLGRARARVR